MRDIKKLTVTTLLGFLCVLLLAGRGDAATRPSTDKPAASATTPASGVVNINEATGDQLELLPGVGPSRAKQILDYRKQHTFKRVEELTRIKGVGKKTFAKLRPLVALSGPTTLTERPSSARRSTKAESDARN